jgi:Zn-dependent M28 family amino/carboxypeptidase
MQAMKILKRIFAAAACAACKCSARPIPVGQPGPPTTPIAAHADTAAMSALARELSSDAMRGRGPWTPENARAARLLATRLQALGAKPVFGDQLLVPFTSAPRPDDTVYNVVGILPNAAGHTSGELVGITAHLDHLGVGPPDATGDSIYNGFLDDATGDAMVLDVATRYARSPGARPLLVMFFNLEEQGLLGSKALVARHDAGALLGRLGLLIGVDAGAPAGEALEWQLMGAAPPSVGSRLADSLAAAHGWTTTSTPPRPISDVYPFSQHGVPILFPIPGKTWRGYTADQRDAAMAKFDHYHQPSDQWRADFPWIGAQYFADWLWEIVHAASNAPGGLR